MYDEDVSDDPGSESDSDSDWEPELEGQVLLDGIKVEQLKTDM